MAAGKEIYKWKIEKFFFATRCFENKMEPKVVQALLGHSSISITLNIYTHVLDKKMDEEL